MKTRTTHIIAVVLSFLIPVVAKAETVLEQLDAANKAFATAIVAGDIDHLVNGYGAEGRRADPRAIRADGRGDLSTARAGQEEFVLRADGARG